MIDAFYDQRPITSLLSEPACDWLLSWLLSHSIPTGSKMHHCVTSYPSDKPADIAPEWVLQKTGIAQ